MTYDHFSPFKGGQLTQDSIKYRGHVLHYMSLFEFILNGYISTYFCGGDTKKNEEMYLLILGDERMSLVSKAQVFYSIATNHDKDWYNSYESVRVHPEAKKKYSMNNDLVYIIEERNVFAHRIIDTDNVFNHVPINENTVRFVRIKNEIQVNDYDNKKCNELIDTIFQITNHMLGNERTKLINTALAPSA